MFSSSFFIQFQYYHLFSVLTHSAFYGDVFFMEAGFDLTACDLWYMSEILTRTIKHYSKYSKIANCDIIHDMKKTHAL